MKINTNITFEWNHQKRYNDFSSHFKKLFSERVQKISIDAGFTCPNRDGTKYVGGCTYCNNESFNPFYTTPNKIIKQQLAEGIAFFSPKYKTQQYLAYFQAYSNTYGKVSDLKKMYEEALSVPQVIGLVIATRPDCVNEEIIAMLENFAKQYYVVLEFGVESCNDETLKKINRGHTFNETINALNISSSRGIHVGIHLILGLPGDSYENIKEQAKIISQLPFETLKLHQLQIIKKTKMAKEFEINPEHFKLYTAEEYINLVVDFVELLNPAIIIERFISESPMNMIIAPNWGGLKNFEIVNKIEKKLLERNTFQGKYFEKSSL